MTRDVIMKHKSIHRYENEGDIMNFAILDVIFDVIDHVIPGV